MRHDYYDLLRVSRSATQEEIKRAYKSRVVELHPDRNPGDTHAEERFKELSQAYQVLSDPSKRALYDRYGAAMFEQGHSQEFVGRDMGAFAELFGSLVGDWVRRASRAAKPRGRDISYELLVSFEEAARGVSRNIEVPESTQPMLVVQVPPGVESGAVKTIRGAGQASASDGEPGDLFVTIRIEEHPVFRRQGANVVVDLPLSFTQAALGAHVQVPTLDGAVTMKIPAGTQPGKVFRLRGKGLAVFGGYGKGDQLVHAHIEVPETLTERQRQLIEALAAELGEEAHPRQKGFLKFLARARAR